jgi:hypothetical protein
MNKLFKFLGYKIFKRINPVELIEENKEEIKKECNAVSVEKKKEGKYLAERIIDIDGEKIWIGIKNYEKEN